MASSLNPNASPYYYQGRSYEYDTWFACQAVSALFGNDVYGGYELISTHQMQTHQQHLPQASSLPSHQTQNPHIRYLSIDDFLNQQDSRPINYSNIPFHLEDDVMIIEMFPPPGPYEMWLATQDLPSHQPRANAHVPDEAIEASLKMKLFTSPTNLSTEVSSLDEDHNICAICLAEYENKEKIGALQCGHEYHAKCIMKWLRKKNVCPVCRATAVPS